jgi:hypothetical protein
MSRSLSPKNVIFGLWIALLPLLVVMLLWPVNSHSLRLGILLAASGLILGSLFYSWNRRPVFLGLVGIFFAVGFFLLQPGCPPVNPAGFQKPYVESMRAYEGASYVWGGETRFGMDCSGLVRKSFQNTLLKAGILTCNPYFVRGAIDLWWNDTTASEIGKGYDGRTVPVTSCSSLNSLDHSLIQPGDLAVTTSGTHVMAYLGHNQWVGADPGEMKVTVFSIPETKNGWFSCPMNIVRWSKLAGNPANRAP